VDHPEVRLGGGGHRGAAPGGEEGVRDIVEARAARRRLSCTGCFRCGAGRILREEGCRACVRFPGPRSPGGAHGRTGSVPAPKRARVSRQLKTPARSPMSRRMASDASAQARPRQVGRGGPAPARDWRARSRRPARSAASWYVSRAPLEPRNRFRRPHRAQTNQAQRIHARRGVPPVAPRLGTGQRRFQQAVRPPPVSCRVWAFASSRRTSIEGFPRFLDPLEPIQASCGGRDVEVRSTARSAARAGREVRDETLPPPPPPSATGRTPAPLSAFASDTNASARVPGPPRTRPHRFTFAPRFVHPAEERQRVRPPTRRDPRRQAAGSRARGQRFQPCVMPKGRACGRVPTDGPPPRFAAFSRGAAAHGPEAARVRSGP